MRRLPPKDANVGKQELIPVVPKKFCQLCGEYFSEVEDPYHLEACRDSRKP